MSLLFTQVKIWKVTVKLKSETEVSRKSSNRRVRMVQVQMFVDMKNIGCITHTLENSSEKIRVGIFS